MTRARKRSVIRAEQRAKAQAMRDWIESRMKAAAERRRKDEDKPEPDPPTYLHQHEAGPSRNDRRFRVLKDGTRIQRSSPVPSTRTAYVNPAKDRSLSGKARVRARRGRR